MEAIINAHAREGTLDEGLHAASEALERYRVAGDQRMQAAMYLAMAELNTRMR
eukprot:CAMPEP_0198553960 /NCGR_PEP_ID=MMETSP1462-20131121/81535_1 /TAXON_ID=1333877 /ORGANISM="Brandtodinium nutriculum, Strain RCC3387" /LENGTH=52 /DNA_ID=CAMNT_0044284651 /DNA_START=1 /DNA_END=156 /DNA_ORIENTATION=+